MSRNDVTKALIDCRDCGGSGCRRCRHKGVRSVRCEPPPADFTVRADADGFQADREDCPCYEGVKINAGVDQCTHPDNRAPENWCDPERCPVLRAMHAHQVQGGELA